MKKLVIVCEERLRSYGDFLAQLISRKDDTEENIIGVKDGSVVARVWTEAEYEGNQAQISSEQYILFIGNSKLMKDKRKFFKLEFSKYGMNYGWLGRQANLDVTTTVSAEKYAEFYDYAINYQPNSKKLLKTEYKVANELTHDEAIVVEATVVNEEEPKLEDKKQSPTKFLKNAVSGFASNGERAISKFQLNLNKAMNNKKIEEQEYSCLVLIFYLEGLSKFLEISES